MTTQNRAIEEERRECRRRWAACRAAWRYWWARFEAAEAQGAKLAKYEASVHVEHYDSLMREAAAARLSTAARGVRAEANSSCPAHGSAALDDLRAQMRALAAKWQAEGEALTNYTTDEDKDETIADLRPSREERLERWVTLHNCSVDLRMLASGQLRLEAGRRADEGKPPNDD